MKYLFFDTETTGVPKNYKAPASDVDNWPRMVQLAFILTDESGNVIIEHSQIIKPVGFEIPDAVVKIHGITNERAQAEGEEIGVVLNRFHDNLCLAYNLDDPGHLVAHNMNFDVKIISAEMFRFNPSMVLPIIGIDRICTMQKTTNLLRLPGQYGYKWPKLQELHSYLFGSEFEGAHDAMADIRATAKCFFELKKRGQI